MHRIAEQLVSKQQERYKELYDQRCRAAKIEVGDLVLVK